MADCDPIFVPDKGFWNVYLLFFTAMYIILYMLKPLAEEAV